MSRLPSLTPGELIAALERAGLRIVRQGRRHTIMWREGLPRPVPIPRHVRELKRGLVVAIAKQAGLTPTELRKHLAG